MMQYKRYMTTLMLSSTLLYGGFFGSEQKVVVRTQPAMDVAYEKHEAFSLVNEVREALGMNTLMENLQLVQAAQAHAEYLVKNRSSAHTEVEGLPGFTGVHPYERAFHAGYLSTFVTENLSTQNKDAKSSVDGLFSAIYHRFGFLNVGIDEMGVGAAQQYTDTKNSAFVYEMGNSELNALCREPSFQGSGRYMYHVCKDPLHRIASKRFEKAQNSSKWMNPKVIFYPYDGEEEVPPAFYSEIPDPLPDYEVSGFPVSVTFNDYFFHKVKLRSFKLFQGSSTKPVPARLLSKQNDPNGRFSRFEFALFPLERLAYDTKYRAQISYIYKGREVSKSWHFHTKKPLEKLIYIRKKEATITLTRGRGYWLYFVPMDGHDTLSDILFPEDIDIAFIDNNTLRISPMGEKSSDFTLRSGKRTLHVKVVD